jgi:hypothetical protein
VTATLRVPASPSLCACATALREVAADPSAVRAAARAAGEAWVESVLDGFVLPVAAAARGRPAGRRTAAAARDLADGLIGAGTRRLDGAAAAAFVAFLDERLAPGPPPTIAVPLDPPLAAALARLARVSADPGAPAPPWPRRSTPRSTPGWPACSTPRSRSCPSAWSRAPRPRSAAPRSPTGSTPRSTARSPIPTRDADRLRALLVGYLPPA